MPVLTRKDRGSIGVRHKDDIVLGVDTKNLIIKFQMISVLTRISLEDGLFQVKL